MIDGDDEDNMLHSSSSSSLSYMEQYKDHGDNDVDSAYALKALKKCAGELGLSLSAPSTLSDPTATCRPQIFNDIFRCSLISTHTDLVWVLKKCQVTYNTSTFSQAFFISQEEYKIKKLLSCHHSESHLSSLINNI